MLDLVTWSSCDNRATTRHGGRLISHPPHQQTWALRVPTLVSCYFGLVYFIDTPFRLQDRWIRTLPHSRIGCRLYAPLYLLSGFVPHFPHEDSCLSYRLTPLHVLIIHQSHSLTLLHLISSSSAGLYFLSLIIISPVSLLACMLKPLNFYPTHPSWPPTLEPSITSWILILPDRHVCYDCLHPALDLAVALAKSLFVCAFSCEDTRPRALVLSRQPLTRALL